MKKLILILGIIACISLNACAQEKSAGNNGGGETKPAPATLEQMEEWYKTGSLWQVGTDEHKKKITDARQALIGQGSHGLDFILTKLDIERGLELRCITTVIKGLKEIAVAPLIAKLKDENHVVRANATDLLGGLGDPKAIAAILPLLKDTNARVSRNAVSALTTLKAEAAIPEFISLLEDRKGKTGRIGIISGLGKFKAEEAIPILLETLDDESYAYRYGAQDALIAIGGTVFDCVSEELKAGKAGVMRTNHLLLIMGRSDKIEHQRIIAGYLSNEDWSVRGYAVKAMGHQQLPEHIALLKQQLETEKHPFVLGRIKASLTALESPKKE
ncbi:HEAT repeat domain-containing protein [Planctomycetota bacterium]